MEVAWITDFGWCARWRHASARWSWRLSGDVVSGFSDAPTGRGMIFNLGELALFLQSAGAEREWSARNGQETDGRLESCRTTRERWIENEGASLGEQGALWGQLRRHHGGVAHLRSRREGNPATMVNVQRWHVVPRKAGSAQNPSHSARLPSTDTGGNNAATAMRSKKNYCTLLYCRPVIPD